MNVSMNKKKDMTKRNGKRRNRRKKGKKIYVVYIREKKTAGKLIYRRKKLS